jgi:hypothetical protein
MYNVHIYERRTSAATESKVGANNNYVEVTASDVCVAFRAAETIGGVMVVLLYLVVCHTHIQATTDGEWPLGARAPGWSRAPSLSSSSSS